MLGSSFRKRRPFLVIVVVVVQKKKKGPGTVQGIHIKGMKEVSITICSHSATRKPAISILDQRDAGFIISNDLDQNEFQKEVPRLYHLLVYNPPHA